MELSRVCGIASLDLDWFQSLKELNQRIQDWSVTYNQIRPHSSIGYKSPVNYENLNQNFYFRVVAA
ncbi:integrase core domain-containing protein [Neolewinella agarilytica]|uniref:integrase core domain-containing protein n=1 Tax=Neolewinella agarilytica TaxID=478744 RepID=UPI00387357FA